MEALIANEYFDIGKIEQESIAMNTLNHKKNSSKGSKQNSDYS